MNKAHKIDNKANFNFNMNFNLNFVAHNNTWSWRHSVSSQYNTVSRPVQEIFEGKCALSLQAVYTHVNAARLDLNKDLL